ncbi:MAG TPA: hypothetical protein VJT78_03995 [Candidatus Dormibacteraeota bacterium]|nr:hypothetical protein [Candidatus Dormibacteraeota bacterium]
MPSVAVAGPTLVPLLVAAVITTFGFFHIDLGRGAAAIGAWGAVAALLVLWISVRSTQELTLGPLGYGSTLNLRVDAIAFAFGLMVAAPSAVVLTLQPRTWQETSLALVGLAAAMAAIEAGGIVLTAVAGGTAATLAVLLLDAEDIRAPRPRWSVMLAAWLALAWAGVILQVLGGTAVYAAVPVAALTAPVFTLLAMAALLASGLFPWRSWPAQVWARPSLRAAGMAICTVYPLGFYLLVRAYEMGDGHYPRQLFNVVLSVLGVLVALGAAVRAQGAETRREFLGEVVPGFGGFALMTIALGTPLGLAAGLITLATGSAIAACLPILPDRAGLASLVTIAAAVGLPPGLAFGARLVGLESTFEGGNLLGLIGLAGAGTWALWMVGGARAIGLPAGRGHPVGETFPSVAMAIAGLTVLAGPAIAAFQAGFAAPAVGDVMPGGIGTNPTLVVTVSTVLPALTLFVPLLLIAAIFYALAGTSLIRGQPRAVPFSVPGGLYVERWRARLRGATVPEEYRSLVNLRAIESVVAGGRPLLWMAALVALAFAVTR